MTNTTPNLKQQTILPPKNSGWPDKANLHQAVIRFPTGMEGGNWQSRSDETTREYTRTDLVRAEVDALVAAAYEAAAAEAAGEVAAHGCAEFAPFMRRRIRAITPADASAALRAQIEAAVKRALEGAAEHLSMFAEPGVSLDYSLEDEIKAIRALDPAQFIDGDKT